jgi:hypothetical protein
MAASQDLCTRANVQEWLNIAAGTDNDFIDNLIDRASEWVENWCDRQFKSQQYTEYLTGEELSDGDILVESPPIRDSSGTLVRTQTQIDADVAVYDDTNKAWGSGTAIATTNLGVEAEVGLIHSDIGFYKGSVGNVKVVYYGGYPTIPTDVAQACVRLVAFWYNKSKQRADGVLSESESGMSVKHDPDEIPNSVVALLAPYERRRV